MRNSAKHHVRVGFPYSVWQHFIDAVKSGEFDGTHVD
jgi:hypothetical protein